VTVVGVPAQVAGLSATPKNDGSLEIDWTIPGDGGSTLTGYAVEYSLSDPAGTPNWTSYPHSGTALNVNLSEATDGNLTAGTAVWVRVRASNGQGDGEWSAPLAASMPDVPTGVLDVAADATVTDGTVTLTWTYEEPVLPELPLTTFVIEYRESGTTSWLPVAAASGALDRYVITGLNPGDSYEFKLTAENVLGLGVSATVEATPTAAPGDAPANLQVVPQDAAVRLDWDAPDSVSEDSADYRVQWLEYQDGVPLDWSQAQQQLITVTGGTTHTVTDPNPNIVELTAWPENYRRYVFRLAVRDQGVFGAYSQISSVVVPRRVIDAPTNLSGTSPGSQQISLSWTAPVPDAENPITGYLVEYSSDASTTWSTAADTDGNAADNAAILSGLDQGVTYDIRVAAVTTVTLSGEEVTGATATTSVTIVGVPAEVAGLSATPQTDGSLAVDWAVPGDGGAALTGYEVAYSLSDPTGTPNWTSYPHSGTDTNVDLSAATDANLTAGVEIWVRVRASNGSGNGAWSQPVAAAMPAAPAGTLSISMADVSGNDGNVMLTWTYQEPALPEIPLTAYVLEYRTGGGAWQSAGEVAASTAGTPSAVSGLTNGTAYEFRVSAKNALGVGASDIAGPATPREPADAPQNLQAVSGTGEIQLSWEAPADDGGTAIVDYEIQRSTNAGGSWTPVVDAVETATAATIPNLVNGVQYRFRVRALTAGGSLAGAWTEMDADVEPLGLATAPQNLTADPAQDAVGGRIDLAWTAPSETGGRPVTGYVIEYGDATDSQNIVWENQINVGVITAYQVEGLDPGSPYVFRVAAVTAEGQGAWATSSAVVPSRLNAPENIRSNTTASSITVAWSEPAGGYGSGTAINYEVEISQGGQSMTRLTNGALWTTFSNLPGETTFAIRVRALLSSGTVGIWSDVHLATTL